MTSKTSPPSSAAAAAAGVEEAEVLLEFLECWTHEVLASRKGIYHPESFDRLSRYGGIGNCRHTQITNTSTKHNRKNPNAEMKLTS